MDRALLERNLALAETHVVNAERVVRGQRELIGELERDGHDTVLARQLLRTYEQAFDMHRADRDRLRRLLGDGA